MHFHRYYHLAVGLLVLCALAAVLMAGVIALGIQLSLVSALVALAVVALLFGGMAYVHDAMRAARWNAGHRLH